jgi:hypothetical protein
MMAPIKQSIVYNKLQILYKSKFGIRDIVQNSQTIPIPMEFGIGIPIPNLELFNIGI